MSNLTDVTALAVVEDQAESTVRRECIDGVWYFSVVDLIAFLTESPDPTGYWRTLKTRLRSEGSESASKCSALKMVAADGKMRKTDCADAETLLRIIQSVPLPKAEPVKRWLAKIGAQQLEGLARPVVASPSNPSAEIAAIPRPSESAPALDWAAYYEALASVYRRQAIVETTLVEHGNQLMDLDSRLQGVEEGLRMMFDQIGPATLSPEQLSTVKAQAKRLHDTTGVGFQTIYWELQQHFHVSKIEQLPADSWSEIVGWFMRRIK